MIKAITVFCLFFPFFVKGQFISASDLDKIVRMDKASFHKLVLQRGYNLYGEFDPPFKADTYGKLTVYTYSNQNGSMWTIVYVKAGAIAYYPDKSSFFRLKSEIDKNYKNVGTISQGGSQQILYQTPLNRFSIVLDDGSGRRAINVFLGYGK